MFPGAKDTLTSGKLGLIVGLTFSSLLNPEISYSRVIRFSFSIPSSRERVKTLILIRERERIGDCPKKAVTEVSS